MSEIILALNVICENCKTSYVLVPLEEFNMAECFVCPECHHVQPFKVKPPDEDESIH